MLHPKIWREIAERYHRALPDDIRAYLKSRGIPATIIAKHRLGWNGTRITIPVFGRSREVLGFRLAKVPEHLSDGVETISELGLEAELYGWETLAGSPKRVVVCDGEFARLVLDANDVPAVTSTTGAQPFLEEWLPHLEAVKHVYICFRRGLVGAAAAKRLQRLLPRARIVTLPPEVGLNGGVTEFFVELGRTRVDFEVLLSRGEGAPDDGPADPSPIIGTVPRDKRLRRRAGRVRHAVRLHDIAAIYIDLQASGTRLTGQCPFHDGSAESFTVDPKRDTYRCAECGAAGDVVTFVMDKESMTLSQALQALEQFPITHELYGNS